MTTKINQVTSDMNDVSVEATVVEVSDTRDVNTRYGPRKVATAVIEDESGRINLTLWEDQIKKVEQGKKVKIAGAYVTEWNDQLQLNMGKSGTLTVE